MKKQFNELVRSFDLSSNDDLKQLEGYFNEQTDESIDETYSTLVILEQKIWTILNIDFQQYFERSDCLNFFQLVADWNKKLIFNQNQIDEKRKSTLLIPETSIDRIFQTIEQIQNDNHPLILIISRWFENFAYLIHEYPQLSHLPIVNQINQQLIHRFSMSELFKTYLKQLQQSTEMTNKQIFYLRTCSLSLNAYFYSNPQNCDEKFDDILPRIGTDYLNSIETHSLSVDAWSKELLGCLGCLIGFVRSFIWWEGEKGSKIKTLLPTDSILRNYIEALVRIILYEPFHENLLTEWSNNETILVDSLLLSLINIVQTCNISWLFRTLTEFNEVLLKFGKISVYFRIHLCSYGILGHILTDDVLKELQIADNIKFFFFNMLEEAWKNPSKRYKQIPIDYFLQGFLNLAKNDFIQQRVVFLNNTQLFIDMCDDYPIVYDIIWTLSFNKDIQEQLRSNSSFTSKLVRLDRECANNELMKKAIDGIRWNLEVNHDDRSKIDIGNKKTFDIMISYSHKDKQLCKQIYDELIKSNYQVWIDFDQMRGNVMDAMAQAIESSPIVIICMSEDYRKSNFCRAEAHYAFKRQRKIVPVLLQKHYRPDGWLLFLIGQLLYVDFNKHEFNRAMNMLYNELKTEENCETSVPSEQQPTTTEETILEWTSVQVQQWLIDNKLHQISRLLADCDGRSLIYFSNYLKKAQPNQVLNLMQTEAVRQLKENLSLVELCRLQSLIDKEEKLFRLENTK